SSFTTLAGGLTLTGAAGLTTNSGTGGTTFNLTNALPSALLAAQGANNYIQVATTVGAEAINLGNATTNPAINLLGTGTTTLGGATTNPLITVPGSGLMTLGGNVTFSGAGARTITGPTAALNITGGAGGAVNITGNASSSFNAAIGALTLNSATTTTLNGG